MSSFQNKLGSGTSSRNILNDEHNNLKIITWKVLFCPGYKGVTLKSLQHMYKARHHHKVGRKISPFQWKGPSEELSTLVHPGRNPHTLIISGKPKIDKNKKRRQCVIIGLVEPFRRWHGNWIYVETMPKEEYYILTEEFGCHVSSSEPAAWQL